MADEAKPQTSPLPWQQDLAPPIAKGCKNILIHDEPPRVDMRILSEPNYQLALKSVNALPGVLDLLKRLRSTAEVHCMAINDETTALLNEVDAELLAHGIKFTD